MPSRPFRKQHHDPIVESAIARHGAAVEATVSILQAVQDEAGYLKPDAIGAASDGLRVSDAHVYGVASFYSMFSTQPRAKNIIRVCDGPVCALCGGGVARAAIEAAIPNGEWTVERSSCLGLCDHAPAALVGVEPCGPIAPDRAGDILEGWRGEARAYAQPLPGEVRVTMARLGPLRVAPDSIDSAIDSGAYATLKNALNSSPADVLKAVDDSGLRGRGGAGFPTGRKWQIVAASGSGEKYIVCNFDESEPGAFKDRVVGEGDPHLLLEGMALAGYAVGAREGFIYIRGEYEWIARRLERAIAEAEERGWLGNHIQGTDFSFKVHVHRGAGAYICGEETALLESLEGRRGVPRIRPPFPASHGYHGKPTVLDNVETLCSVPPIVERGAAWYRSMGTENSAGVKVFTVMGHVNRTGAFEAPFGVTLRQVIEQFGGGMQPGSKFKMALTGGAAGTIVDASLLDVPLDYASSRQGISLGAGVMLVLDESASAVELLLSILCFFEAESCGKCTPCREGTREARILVERIANGEGHAGEVDELRRLARMMNVASFCGLGQSAAWPIESALKYFGHEFETTTK
jgi:NADH-quinone oxidoreductase subunit F